MLRIIVGLVAAILVAGVCEADTALVVEQIQAAAAARVDGDLDAAIETIEAALTAARAEALPPGRLATVLAIATEIHLEAASLQAAQRHLVQWDELELESDRSRRVEMWLATMAGAVDQTDTELTLAAADRLAGCESSDTRHQAALARVWALTHSINPDAPKAIEDFLRDFGDDDASDTADVMAMRLFVAQSSGDEPLQWETRMRLVAEHRDSDAAAAAALTAPPEVPREHAKAWTDFLVQKRESIIAQSASVGGAEGLAHCLLCLIVENHPHLDRYATALLAADRDGTAVAGVLQFATATDAATQLAADWLVTEDPSAAPMAIESVARWCGRADRWDTLADAAGEAPEDQDRTLHTERLFAEALLVSGRPAESVRWWTRVIDDRGADDFATLLRAAEATVAAGTVPQSAGRLAAAGARAVTAQDTALVDLVTAELEIRRLRFDHSRAALQRVVRHSPDASVRGRAQWTIGETYFMQEQFEPAIEAYRMVESVGGTGRFAAAALVQAGAAFEKLGRTADASVCYQRLLARYGDSEHAAEAAQRIAGLSPAVTPAGGTLRR